MFSSTVETPLWLLLVLLTLAAVAALDRIMMPSVRWFLRRRLERAVARLNQRLQQPIQPFKLARRHDMIQRLIYDPQVSQAIADYAREADVPENVAFEKARHYAREIVPSFSASLYFGIAIRLARLISTTLYRVRLGYFDDEALSAIDPDATVVFVMNHRSNVDYVLVTYLAADRSALSYAVGEWAQVWPLSRLISAMGAYFIRRRSRNDLYRKVLARYVRLATDAGVTQAMFPEGGLSLTGALMPPKMGLLKYIADGFDPGRRDVVFVPVALNYDRVLEDQVLISAASESERRFRAGIGLVARQVARLVWLRLTGRYHRFGYAAVSFGAPLSLRDWLTAATDRSTEALGDELMTRIGSIVPVLPVPLVAWLILTCGPLSRAELRLRMRMLIEAIPQAHVHIPRDSREYALEVGLRNLTERSILMDEGGQYAANPAHIKTLQYYARSIEHLMPDDFLLNSATANDFSASAGS